MREIVWACFISSSPSFLFLLFLSILILTVTVEIKDMWEWERFMEMNIMRLATFSLCKSCHAFPQLSWTSSPCLVVSYVYPSTEVQESCGKPWLFRTSACCFGLRWSINGLIPFSFWCILHGNSHTPSFYQANPFQESCFSFLSPTFFFWCFGFIVCDSSITFFLHFPVEKNDKVWWKDDAPVIFPYMDYGNSHHLISWLFTNFFPRKRKKV